MSNLNGIIEHIVFRSDDTGWSVMTVRPDGMAESVTVVGDFLEIPEGTMLELDGEWRVDARFGRQFVTSAWKIVMPATATGIERYLGSGLIKGIGPVYAKAIVRRFGLETFNIIENHSERLREIDGLGPKRIGRIVESWSAQKEIRQVMVFLQGNGVSPAYATKIYKAYGNEAVKRVRENPYRLADEIWGIGFKTADSIAANMGYGKDDPRRCRSGLKWILSQFAEQGHVFAFQDQLANAAKSLLELDITLIHDVLDVMVKTGDIIADGEAFYIPKFYHAELGSAKKLKVLMASSPSVECSSQPSVSLETEGICYDEVQSEAIRMAVALKVMVLTGGPGTGKTTTVQGILAAYKAAGMKILLAAPTGRAAKRMSETTGMSAKTIHRLLGYNPASGWEYDSENQLQGDALIVDECSMIDIQLFHALLSAIPVGMRLVLVGDVDQLPSVGAGNVLRGIIVSGTVPVVRLTRIFRQAQSSRIVLNAHAINNGCLPDVSNGRDTDFFFMRAENAGLIPGIITDLVAKRLPKAYGISPNEIQVLTPMRRGDVGAVSLNVLLQKVLNSRGEALTHGAYTYREGDKVMQIRNDYDKKVFNGDIGYISAVDRDERMLEVDFDGKIIEYESSDLDELTLAYAITIHKSQGSEFPVVVIPVTMKHCVMLQRNLIYTGVTRAKRICVLVGDMQALGYAINNRTTDIRNDRLAERLKK